MKILCVLLGRLCSIRMLFGTKFCHVVEIVALKLQSLARPCICSWKLWRSGTPKSIGLGTLCMSWYVLHFERTWFRVDEAVGPNSVRLGSRPANRLWITCKIAKVRSKVRLKTADDSAFMSPWFTLIHRDPQPSFLQICCSFHLFPQGHPWAAEFVAWQLESLLQKERVGDLVDSVQSTKTCVQSLRCSKMSGKAIEQDQPAYVVVDVLLGRGFNHYSCLKFSRNSNWLNPWATGAQVEESLQFLVMWSSATVFGTTRSLMLRIWCWLAQYSETQIINCEFCLRL